MKKGECVFRGTLAALLVSLTAFGSIAEEKKIFSLRLQEAFDGSSIGTRYRVQENKTGMRLFDQAQYQVDLKIQLAVFGDGRLKVLGRAITGKTFDGDWDEAGIGKKDSEFDFNLNLRHLYFDYSLSENASVQGGAMPVLPAQMKADGALAVDTSGWVDGIRGNLTTMKSWAKDVSVTVGQVDEYNSPSAYDREWGSPNFIQIHVRGTINKRMAFMLEGTNYDAQDDEQFLRGILEISVKDVVSFVDAVVIEELLQNSDDAHQGFAVTLKKAIQNWTLAAAYSFKDDEISIKDANHLPREDFFGRGRQASLMVTRKLPRLGGAIFFRAGKSLDDVKFFSLKGARIEGGLRYTFGARKKK